MFSEPTSFVFISTLASEIIIAALLGLYLVSDVKRKQVRSK